MQRKFSIMWLQWLNSAQGPELVQAIETLGKPDPSPEGYLFPPVWWVCLAVSPNLQTQSSLGRAFIQVGNSRGPMCSVNSAVTQTKSSVVASVWYGWGLPS